MDLRLTFNSDPKRYDDLRPRYCKDLFDDLLEYTNLSENDKALEIGLGTGQATQRILESKCQVTGVELGEHLADYSKRKFEAYSNLNIIKDDFERVQLNENYYDLVYSATAFHWIPLDSGIKKVKDILRDHGTFAWFSNHPMPARQQRGLHDSIQNIYKKYSDYFGPCPDIWQLDEINNKRLEERSKIFEDYGFKDIVSKHYRSTRHFTGQAYCDLLMTYSGHIALPDSIKKQFLEEIKILIEEHDDHLIIADSILMVMGRKS